MKRLTMRRLVIALCTSGLLGATLQAQASGFQLWEQDGASLANYHAAYAVWANDASTAWYNPAGIIRIPNQQIVLGGVAITSAFKYRGSVTVMESGLERIFNSVTAQGGTFNFVPDFHYVAPINDKIGVGFSVVVPFGLKTDYGRRSPLRYAATLTSLYIVDFTPSVGFKITDNASIGAGFDIQRASAEFDSIGVLIFSDLNTDTNSTNKASGTGYGYHLGALYQFSPCSRIGLSYHSQVVHHLSGTSKFQGPIADALNDDQDIISNHATTRFTLPPYTALSVYNRVSPRVALMGSVIYTQWSTFKTLVLNGFAGAIVPPGGFFPEASNNIQVTIPEHYRNTWNVSVGLDYDITEQMRFRTGIGWDQTPVKNSLRNVQLPDNSRWIVALGGHYQATKCLGFDLGWAHLFISQANINPPPQVMGAQSVLTNGSANGGADVLGGQITWDIV